MHRIPEGWTLRPLTSFDTTVGPFYFPEDGDKTLTGFFTDDRHANRRGVVHGGVIATAFDVAFGTSIGRTLDHHSHATIQLNVHFIGAVKLHEFVVVRAEISRSTRSVVFVRGVMSVADRVVATADGLWKILADPTSKRVTTE